MKVLLATPAYGGQVTAAYFQSVLGLLNQAGSRGIQVDVMTLTNESLITRGRNEIVATFLAGDWSDLLWVDADIAFDPEHAFRLLDSPHPVAVTSYAMKGLNWEQVAKTDGDAEAHKLASVCAVTNAIPDAEPVEGFVEVLDAGTGFMRIKRQVLETLVAAHPETAYETENADPRSRQRWAIFDCIIHEGRYLSEDYTFCRRWQALGGKIMADIASRNLGHQGSYIFGR
jgi:hypothetical protein